MFNYLANRTVADGSDVAYGMDPEDGLIWVFGLGDDGIMAFTDFGIENLMELIRIHKENPELLKR